MCITHGFMVGTCGIGLSFHRQCRHTLYKLGYQKHDIGLFHLSTLAAAVAEPPTQRSHWISQGNNFSTPLREDVFKDDCIVNTCFSALQACTNAKELNQLHAYMLTNGLDQNIPLVSKLVSIYANRGSMNNALLLFERIYEPSVFLWNVMIKGYASEGCCEEALVVYYQMQLAGTLPDKFTFPFVLKACAGLSALEEGKEIHDRIIRSGFESDVFVANSLIAMYAKCGRLQTARQVFDKMSERNVVSWNAMLAGYAQNEYGEETLMLFDQMLLADVIPDEVTLLSVVQGCAHLGALQRGKWVHDYIVERGLDSDVSLRNSLVAMYAKCGEALVARQLFDKMSERNVVSWTAMISGYAQSGGHANEALTLFREMQVRNVKPNSVTMVGLLQACAQIAALQQGKGVHGYVIRNGLELEVFVGNSLIDMYAKCGCVEIARLLFDKMCKRNVVSWSSMISGYTQNGNGNEALELFWQMQLANVTPNSVTMVSVLHAIAHLAALHQGKWIHGCILKRGLEGDTFVVNSLIDMYAKCGSLKVACQLFDKMFKRDVVSWNAMIVGYASNGHVTEALVLFNRMQLESMKPNSATVVVVLPLCAHLTALRQGKWIHGYTIRNGFESDVLVGNSLIDMYAKCGSVEIARQLFEKMSARNIVSWNAMIAGYGMHGHGEDALGLFSKMQQAGIEPNNITFICVLSACSHAGLVVEGWQYFDCLTQHYCITPQVEHYACMVDLLGRAGHLDQALGFIKKMPLEPGASVWGALLSACRIHCNIRIGEYVAERLFELEPENAGCYVLLSNIYAAAGRWDDVANVRTLMKDRGLKKTAGRSLIELNGTVHAFLVGDRSHPQSEKIYAALDTLAGQMKEAGYVPNTNFVLHDVEEEMKEDMLSSHSEKLAIGFGLINTGPGTPIQITKNLRVCGDCHNATKFISKIVSREIIVRDANRYHHFKNGFCSCGDYW